MKEFLNWSKRCAVVCVLLIFCFFWGSTAYAVEILMGSEGMLVFEPCEITIAVGDTVTSVSYTHLTLPTNREV